VLLIAEACNPEWTSVPLVGWSHARAIAELTDAHLVTQVRNRESILRAGLVEGRDFTAIDSQAVAKWVYRLAMLLRGGGGKGWTISTALSSLSYYYFEYLVWERFGRRISDGEFDIVHRLAPLSPTIPSLLASHCRQADVPFVLGPLNGGVPWPKGFDGARREEREWLSYVRPIYTLLPGYRSTRRDAAAILIASHDTWRQMPREYRPKCFYLPENGIDPARFALRRQRQATKPIRVIFIGRLVPYKGADMLIEAAAPLVRSGAMIVDVLGDGPQMEQLRLLVAREGIESGVRLRGWVAHQQLQHYLAEADVLGFPSIREFGGGVVLEAMAMGVVPVVVNYGGPGELVSDDVGYLVTIGRREQIVLGFRDVLEKLCSTPTAIEERSLRCMRRVQERFTWKVKAAEVMKLYQRLLAGELSCGDSAAHAERSHCCEHR